MIYVASSNAKQDAIVFFEGSSVYSEFINQAVELEELPEGTGLLKCDGHRVWWEEIPTPPTPTPDPVTTLEKLALDYELRLLKLELGL